MGPREAPTHPLLGRRGPPVLLPTPSHDALPSDRYAVPPRLHSTKSASSAGCGKLTPLWCRSLFLFRSFPCKSQQNEEPTSGLEPLTCSLRVIGHVLQAFAGGRKTRIPKPVSFLRLAECCTVLRSRWYQIGIRSRSMALLRSPCNLVGKRALCGSVVGAISSSRRRC